MKRIKTPAPITNQRGIVMITVLLFVMLLTFVGISLADLTIRQYVGTSDKVFTSNALLTAEAGAEQSIFELNTDNSFAGFTTETSFFDDDSQGRGTYQTTITNGTGVNEKVIESTGKVYRYGTNDVMSIRKVRISVVGTTAPGYSVHTGVGGLVLGGSAAITNSSVYVNGTVTMSGAASIGTSSQPTTLYVAHQKCPTGASPGATYATVCTSGQPISMTGSSRIYGSVCATNQTQSVFGSASILTGTGGQGLIPSCVAPVTPMPTYDRAAHVASMTTTVAANNIDYNCSTWKSGVGFVRTMPANTQLTGNAAWNSSCDLTITGNVHITGNLTIGGNARIRIANSLAGSRPIITVDGNITVGGSSQLIPNTSGTSAHFISYRSSAACTPTCTTVTGNSLKSSETLTTVNVAGAGNYPGTIFQSYWSRVVLGGSGNMGSAIGQTVDLSGAGTITFGTTLGSGTSTWTVRSYQYDFD